MVLPASLVGTEADGALRFDGDGDLIADEGAVRLFDHFLTALGEVDVDGVRALVEDAARRTRPEAAAEVVTLFDRYVGYLGELQRAAQVPGTRPRDLLDVAIGLQRAHFGSAEADRMFGADNALAMEIMDRSPTRR